MAPATVTLSQLAHLHGLRSHLPSNVHMAHSASLARAALSFTFLTHTDTHTVSRGRCVVVAKLRTSVDDGAAVVEDDPALVQGGDGVEEVEGPQIPLKAPTKDRFTLALSFVSAKSAVNLITP